MTTDTPSLSVGLFKLIRNDFVTQIPIVRRVYFNNFLQLNSVSSFRCHMVLNSDVTRYIYIYILYRLFTDKSENIRFIVFSVFHFLVVGSVQ